VDKNSRKISDDSRLSRKRRANSCIIVDLEEREVGSRPNLRLRSSVEDHAEKCSKTSMLIVAEIARALGTT
jgi:hypothetical protein